MSESSFIELTELGRDPWRVRFRYACSPDLEHLLWDNRLLGLACNEGVRSEASALAGAFVSAFAPLGWAYGAELRSPIQVPGALIESLRSVGGFLQDHYGWPRHDPFAKLQPLDPTEEEDLDLPRHHRGLMFSAGIDSCRALVDLEQRESAGEARVDWLIHLSNFENLDSMTTDEQRADALGTTHAVAQERGLGWMHLWTNLASVYKHNRLDEKFPENCSFWLGIMHVHHIFTALTVIRPLLARVYLAGGFSELLTRVGSCAGSAAYVDRYAYPAPLELLHETEMRQPKVEDLLDQAPELLSTLRVCYSSGDGTCDRCRKCQATALMIVAGGGDLEQTSFPPTIRKALVERIEEIRHLPEEGHRFFHQSLAGRALSGSRQERWDQLLAMLQG
jgi:hypothetical protein